RRRSPKTGNSINISVQEAAGLPFHPRNGVSTTSYFLLAERYRMRIAKILLIFCSSWCWAQTSDTGQVSLPQSSTSVTVPAGTKLLLSLKSAVNTKTAHPGDGVYLETSFPITQNNRIVIPAGTYVQGVIDNVKRPGRVKGRAEVLFHFNTLIFPSGYTVAVPGALQDVPGADNGHVKDKEGTVQAEGQKGRDAGTIAGP